MMPTQFHHCTQLVEGVLRRFQPHYDTTQGLSDRDATWLLNNIVATIREHGLLGEGSVPGGSDRPAWYIRPMKEAWKRSREHGDLRRQAEAVVTALQRTRLIKR